MLVLGGCLPCLASAPEGWSTRSPRLEIQPAIHFLAEGGPDHRGSFAIEADHREGLFGWWEKTFPVHGGSSYEFSARRQVKHVATPRRTTVARVLWRDDKGAAVRRDKPSWASYKPGERPRAEPEYPDDRETDQHGWTEVSGVFRAPSGATQAHRRARLSNGSRMDGSNGRVSRQGELVAPAAEGASGHRPPPAQEGEDLGREVRAVRPAIEEAARQSADLIVLPETLTYYGSGRTYPGMRRADSRPLDRVFRRACQEAQPVHRRRTDERDRHLVYNVAVLIGPDGAVAGKYRKVCLPRGEIEGGVTPVTNTRSSPPASAGWG